MEKHKFFDKYHIHPDFFRKTGLAWDELLLIKDDFETHRENLEIDANYVAQRLRPIEHVHSVKTRIKDPEHLLEKIIRIKLQNTDLIINVDNYAAIVNDLVGVRVLHLFKEDWQVLHDFILRTWDLKKAPVANIGAADPQQMIAAYHTNGCKTMEHPYGYRSVHYLILFERSKTEKITIEIQVRTILEETWSEVDHLVRYPYINDHRSWSPYLSVLNQLLSQADEVCSYIKMLTITDEAGTGDIRGTIKDRAENATTGAINEDYRQRLEKGLQLLKEPQILLPPDMTANN